MFDRAFFEQDFLKQVRSFAQEQKVTSPVVELLLEDGSFIYLKQILQIKESWFSLAVYDESEPKQLFCPYYGVKRIAFYKTAPKHAKLKELGFQLG
jgi:hypothetical protein